MTGLTELRSSPGKELGVIAAVSGVTVETVLFHRGVLEHVGTAFFRVTFVAQLVRGVRLDQFLAECPVGIMAIIAGDFPLFDRMVGPLVDLGAYVLVAGVAKFGLAHLQVFLPRLMHRMAAVAGNAGRFVLAHFPEGERVRCFVARKTFRVSNLGIGFFLAEGDNPDALFATLIYMDRTGTMASFAPPLVG